MGLCGGSKTVQRKLVLLYVRYLNAHDIQRVGYVTLIVLDIAVTVHAARPVC